MKISELYNALLARLGLSSQFPKRPVPECAYGCPYAHFKAYGTVTDEEGNGIADAEINPVLYPLGETGNKQKGNSWGTYHSDGNGNYHIEGGEVVEGEMTLVTTKDGYAPNTSSFVVSREDFRDSKNRWDMGTCIIAHNIVLKKEEDSDT